MKHVCPGRGLGTLDHGSLCIMRLEASERGAQVWRSERRYRGLRPTFIGRGPKQTRTFATDTGRFGDRQALGCCPCLENRVRLCAEALPLKSVIFYSAPHLTRSPSIRPRNGMDEVYITSWLGLAGTALHGGDTLPLLARAIASGLGNDETTRGGGPRLSPFQWRPTSVIHGDVTRLTAACWHP